MSDQYCFVCASNEGVFLDVTPDNRSTFDDQVEMCLSTKINECIGLSNKICYKCAYELDQCTKFVQKYKKSHNVSELQATKESMPCCFLCHEFVDSARIFDITKDSNVIFNPLRKIRSIFNDDAIKSSDLKLICLSCRYNLDVLYDLKRIHQETSVNLKALINAEINYSKFPKVHTDVVNRKTTTTTFPEITFYGSVNSSDSDSNEVDMAHAKRGRKARNSTKIKNQMQKKSKFRPRHCDKCHDAVANDIDMYRFYHTGLTVCKNCWITMDPNKTRRNRRVQNNLTETKLCTVFLTDVLSQESRKKEQIYETETRKTSDDSLEDEAKSGTSLPSVSYKIRNCINGKARRGRKRRIGMSDMEHTPFKVTRLNRSSIDAEPQSSTHLTNRRGQKRIISDGSSDSDGSLEQTERGSKHINNLNDRVNKSNRKKQKSNSERTALEACLDVIDETSNEDNMSLRSKTKGTMSSSTSTTTSVKKEDEEEKSIRSTRSSRSSTEKSLKSLAQSKVKTEYACDECDKKFYSKLCNAKHKLMHLKQVTIKLEKLTVPIVKEKQETEVDLEAENVLLSRRIMSIHKRTDDPSEEIDINVEDDTDDEEIISLSNEKDVQKKVNIEIRDEDDNIINKSDTEKNESCIEEKSANDGNINIENTEQSTVMSNEIATLETVNDKDTKDKDETSKNKDDDTSKDEDLPEVDKDTTTDKDKASEKRDTFKDEDVQETDVATVEDQNIDEEKGKEIKNDMKVSSTEKEKTISECNDKEDLEETIRDSEMTESSILSIPNTITNNESHGENCKNNLENNCEHNKDETLEEPEISRCDLIDEFSKKDTRELKDNFDDITIVNKDKELEEQQNRSNEENIEVEIIADVDKPNNTENIKSDFSNDDKQTKHNETEDGDEDVTILTNNDNNDEAKCKQITEETALENLKEKRKSEEEIKDLEEFDDNAMNNKHRKIEENSTYILNNSSADAVNEILKEVFDLAVTEVQQREGNSTKISENVEVETLEDISREIRKSADMPSLDPISAVEMDDDIILN